MATPKLKPASAPAASPRLLRPSGAAPAAAPKLKSASGKTITPKSTAKRARNTLVLKMESTDPRFSQRLIYLRVSK